MGRMWQDPCYQHVPPLLPLPHQQLLATVPSRDTLPSTNPLGPTAQERQNCCRMTRARMGSPSLEVLKKHMDVASRGHNGGLDSVGLMHLMILEVFSNLNYCMRAKLLRCHPTVPASEVKHSLWCQEVSLHVVLGWREHGSAILGP